ncbi:MAG: hypothetical protein OEZ06_31580 [Myxococcales bacterium]|nr:hypothetical protein [Myxococcales bacterium]
MGACWLYSLAHAQLRTQVAIHHTTRVISHHHVNVTPEGDNLPKFIELLHEDVSCSLNTLMARERYDQPHELFDDRPTHMLQLRDAEAQALHLQYEYANCVAAGLEDRPEKMPGHVFDFELWKVGHIDVPKPKIYFGDSRPEVIRLEVTPPPLLYMAFDGDLDKLVHSMKRMSREVVQRILAARKRPALGAERVKALHPWSEPKTLRERGGSRVPTFRIGMGGAVGREVRAQAAEEVHQFRREHEDARVARKHGDYEHEFPHGTYNMRVHHRAPIAAEHPGAFLTKAGPTLEEVKARLQEQRQRRLSGPGQVEEVAEPVPTGQAGGVTALAAAADGGARADAGAESEVASGEQVVPSRQEQTAERMRALTDYVVETFAEEAEVICENAEYVPADSDDGRDVEATAGSGAEQAAEPPRGGPVVSHRFDRTVGDQEVAESRRLVVLRDKQKGRPRGGSARGSTDPPT